MNVSIPVFLTYWSRGKWPPRGMRHFQIYFLEYCILFRVSLQFVAVCPIDNKPALIQIMTRMTWFSDASIRSMNLNKLLHVDTCARFHYHIKDICAALSWKKTWISIRIMHIWFNDWISSDNAVIVSENRCLNRYIFNTHVQQTWVRCTSYTHFAVWYMMWTFLSKIHLNLKVCIDLKCLYDLERILCCIDIKYCG